MWPCRKFLIHCVENPHHTIHPYSRIEPNPLQHISGLARCLVWSKQPNRIHGLLWPCECSSIATIIYHLLHSAFLIFSFSSWRASHMFLKDVYKSFIPCHDAGERTIHLFQGQEKKKKKRFVSLKCKWWSRESNFWAFISLFFFFIWFQKVQIYPQCAGLKYSPHIRRAIIPNFIF